MFISLRLAFYNAGANFRCWVCIYYFVCPSFSKTNVTNMKLMTSNWQHLYLRYMDFIFDLRGAAKKNNGKTSHIVGS